MEQLPSLLREASSSVLDRPTQKDVRAHLPSTAPFVAEPEPQARRVKVETAEPEEPPAPTLDRLSAAQMRPILQGLLDRIGTTRKALFTAPSSTGKSAVFVGLWNVDDPPGRGVVYACDGQNPSKTDATQPTGKAIYGGELAHRDFPETGELLQRVLTAARAASEEEWLIKPDGGVVRKDKPWAPPAVKKKKPKKGQEALI